MVKEEFTFIYFKLKPDALFRWTTFVTTTATKTTKKLNHRRKMIEKCLVQ